ncbi:MAG: hypothetical protein ACYSTY_02520 [Planctomycetota bacterium]|jgi:uncharacterized protein YdhG (YjbR/CyaY superfamily)
MFTLKTPARSIAAIAGLWLALTVAGPASIASAQSDSDLRKENQRLRTRVRDLERELDAAQNRIGELEVEVARLQEMVEALRAAPRPSTTAPAPEPPKVTIDESIPHASPRALFNAVVKSYEKEIEALGIDANDPNERTVYLRELQRWAAAVNRDLRSPVEWHVRVLDRQGTRRGATVKLRAVDPKTRAELGDAFDVRLSRNLARRLEQQLSHEDVLVARGTLIPRVRVNEKRTARGVFDKPKFIGPYAELDLTVEVASLMPAKPPPAPPQPR